MARTFHSHSKVGCVETRETPIILGYTRSEWLGYYGNGFTVLHTDSSNNPACMHMDATVTARPPQRDGSCIFTVECLECGLVDDYLPLR